MTNLSFFSIAGSEQRNSIHLILWALKVFSWATFEHSLLPEADGFKDIKPNMLANVFSECGPMEADNFTRHEELCTIVRFVLHSGKSKSRNRSQGTLLFSTYSAID